MSKYHEAEITSMPNDAIIEAVYRFWIKNPYTATFFGASIIFGGIIVLIMYLVGEPLAYGLLGMLAGGASCLICGAIAGSSDIDEWWDHYYYHTGPAYDGSDMYKALRIYDAEQKRLKNK